LAEETLLVPKHHIYLLCAKVQTTADSNKLRTAYHALTEVERDLQNSLITEQKEVHQNISAHFDGLYLADHDPYTEKLAKKNIAIVQYRAKQTELRHLHANESVLAAFQKMQRFKYFRSSKRLSPPTASPSNPSFKALAKIFLTLGTSRVSVVLSVSCMKVSINDHS
jgi:hypothetical protein